MIVRLNIGQKLVERFIALSVRPTGMGVNRTIGGAQEITDAEHETLVSHVCSSHGQPSGRILRQLGLNVVYDESDLHTFHPVKTRPTSAVNAQVTQLGGAVKDKARAQFEDLGVYSAIIVPRVTRRPILVMQIKNRAEGSVAD
jgi:hypothetical protein